CRADPSPTPEPKHSVQFYGDEMSLFTTVLGFLSEGLAGGEPAIVIATKTHTAAILDQLSARLIDVARARELGDLVMLDAEDTLATLMTGDMPNPDAFERRIGTEIATIVK